MSLKSETMIAKSQFKPLFLMAVLFGSLNGSFIFLYFPVQNILDALIRIGFNGLLVTIVFWVGQHISRLGDEE